MFNNEKALEQFTDYFVKNYPGPNTIISNPYWHAPKIFRAAARAVIDNVIPAVPRCGWFGEGRGQCLLVEGHHPENQHTCEEDGRLLQRRIPLLTYLRQQEFTPHMIREALDEAACATCQGRGTTHTVANVQGGEVVEHDVTCMTCNGTGIKL